MKLGLLNVMKAKEKVKTIIWLKYMYMYYNALCILIGLEERDKLIKGLKDKIKTKEELQQLKKGH